MDCEQAIHSISAGIDQEVSQDERTALDAHLAVCESCRATVVAMQLQDATLRRAFAARRAAADALADRVIGQLRREIVPNTARIPWIPMILAAAAGFLAAVIIFRPWSLHAPELAREPDPTRNIERSPPNSDSRIAENTPDSGSGNNVTESVDAEPSPRLTQLVFAKGAIEYQSPGDTSWAPLATGGTVKPGSRIRTDGSGRCEFRTPDGSEVRLNGDTELVIHSNRQFELVRGQVWSSVAEDSEPYQIRVPRSDTKITALGTQFDVACGLVATILTVVQGTTEVEGKAGHELVQFGEQAEIVDGAIAERRRVHDLVVATRWVHEILVLKGHDNAELAKRMDDMLAQIGNAKMSYMAEKEILQLGDHCVLPLTRFIQSDRSRTDRQKRSNAARILAKIAQPWSVEDLIGLVNDDDREVRYYAAKALERLTDGQTQGLTPDEWRDGAVDARLSAIARWHTWWQDNRDQFPAPPVSTEPSSKAEPIEPAPKRAKS